MKLGRRPDATTKSRTSSGTTGALKRGLDLHAAEHLSQLWRSIRTTRASSATWVPTATIEALGARKPKPFEEFVREEQSAFNGFGH